MNPDPMSEQQVEERIEQARQSLDDLIERAHRNGDELLEEARKAPKGSKSWLAAALYDARTRIAELESELEELRD